jgi:flagellar biosynthesis/type III secretory pathway protein FliH
MLFCKGFEEERINYELSEVYELESQLKALEAEKREREAQILTPEIQAQLKALDEEFSENTQPLNKSISALRRRRKERVEQYGLSVKGNGYHIIFRKGSVR